MPKARISVLRNHFFGNNSGKVEQIGTKFTGRCRLRWHAPYKLLTPSAKPAQNGGEKKTHFAIFLSPKQRIVLLTSMLLISVKFEHKTCIGVVMNSFRANS